MIMMWGHLLRLTLVVLLAPSAALAKIYSCDAPNGGTLLTDQPKGKQGCKPISTQSPSPPGGYTPPVDTPPTPDTESLPALPPNALVPSLPLPMAAPGQRPPGPLDQPKPSTGSHAAGEEQAAPESQRCAPRVNPLNPFAGVNCPPASGNNPDETTKP